MAAQGRRTGAIYVWGYASEMVLKAAYFSFIGLADSAPITWPVHLQPAIARGRATHGIPWPMAGAGHNVQAWADLLVAERALAVATVFTPDLRTAVRANGQRIYRVWRETLRYHKNIAYHYEVNQVREAAEWFLVNVHLL
jgi:hypothetical protein